MQHKEFLITGHPRSGTGYMTVLMELAGYNVGHEIMGEHGISSWVFAIPDQYQWWEDTTLRRKDYSFNKHICVVRDPVKTVASVVYTEVMSLPLRSQYIDFSDCTNIVELSAKSVMAWYDIILEQNPDCIIQLEKPLSFLTWLHEQGYTEKPITRYPKTKVNPRSHPKMTLLDILPHLSQAHQEQFIRHALRFGYSFPELDT